MKRVFLSALAVVIAALLFSSCLEDDDDEGGAAGLFGGAGGGSAPQTWDMMLILEGTPCAKSFAARGAGIDSSFPGGYFPGLRVSAGDYETRGSAPEVKMVAYLNNPGLFPVSAGDDLTLSFSYQAQADGDEGDYFLARIADGDRFIVPAEVRGGAMAAGSSVTVQRSFTAQGNGFMVQFIIGLSSPADSFFLDDVSLSKGSTLVFLDRLNDVSSAFTPVAPYGLRALFLPLDPSGGFASAPGLIAGSTFSMKATGGTWFQLYAQGASAGEFSGQIMTYTDPVPDFIGETKAIARQSAYMGDYYAHENDSMPGCEEFGSALISVNPSGNADLSGVWTLRVEMLCGGSLAWGETVGSPGGHLAGDPVSVYRQMMAFGGYPFTTASGANINSMQGLTLGDAGVFLLSSAGTDTQLFGAYDRGSGVFAGQMAGTWPTPFGTCTIIQGQFTAYVDESVFVPPIEM